MPTLTDRMAALAGPGSDGSTPFPTAQSAGDCLRGSRQGCADSLRWTLMRAGLIGAGIYAGGEREKVVLQAVAGSLAVEAFVFGWTAKQLSEGKPASLPSGEAVLNGTALDILATYLVRTTMVAGGLYVAGIRGKRLWKNAAAGTAAIEASVLLWASRELASRPALTHGGAA